MGTLNNATNNFITTTSPNAVSSSSNIVGNTQAQLGSVVGVDANGKPTGGPIYYPLASNAVSIGAGTTSVLSTIASLEGTTPATATDEIGNPRSSNNSIDLGAVQYQQSPTITTNPTNQTEMAGQTATSTASAIGNPTPTVQWQVSTDKGHTFTNISGATSTTLTLSNVQLSQNHYEYRAVFTNSIGTATSSAATLTVLAAPAITSGNSATFTAGERGSFTGVATGSPTPTLTESGALPNGVTFADNGNGTATLGGTPAAATKGTYHFTITAHNGVGSDATQSFTLTVNPSPPPPSPPASLPPLPSLYQATTALTIDAAALFAQSYPAALPLLNALSLQYLGQPLPPLDDLLVIVQADYGTLLKALGVGSK